MPGSEYTLRYGFGSATTPVWHTRAYVAANGTVNPDPADAAVFKPGATALTASFSVPAVGSITGTVTDPGGLANSNVTVDVFDGAGATVPATVTWSDGVYTVYGLIPGTYKLEFVPASLVLAPQYYNDAATLATAAAINVVSGLPTANVNVTLTAGCDRQRHGDGGTGRRPARRSRGRADRRPGPRRGAHVHQRRRHLHARACAAGRWYVEFDGGRAYNGQYYATEYYLGKPTLAGAKPLAINAGVAVTGINEALLSESTTAPGLPKVSGGSLTGLSTDKVALKFKLAAWLRACRVPEVVHDQAAQERQLEQEQAEERHRDRARHLLGGDQERPACDHVRDRQEDGLVPDQGGRNHRQQGHREPGEEAQDQVAGDRRRRHRHDRQRQLAVVHCQEPALSRFTAQWFVWGGRSSRIARPGTLTGV